MISLLFSAVLYHDASMELAHGLRHQSARIYNQFPVFQNNPILRSNSDLNSGDHRLLIRLILFNIIVIVAAGFASYFLARRTLEPIEAAHEQQKRFTADVSHELRTPLTAIRMESEVALMSSTSNSELKSAIKSNLEEVDKLEDLINNLLRLSSLEASELQHQFVPQSVSAICSRAVERIATNAENQHITISQTVVDAQVLGDSDSLQQLLVILLDNALKYSPKDTTINIDTKLTAETVTIAVRDQGVGIERQALEHVFDRFYRADSSRNKTDAEGFGLGLSIAKLIADIHDATITLISQQGQGTTARVTLPRITLDQPGAKPE